MDGGRWEQIQAIFHGALKLPQAERKAFVDAASDDGEAAGEVMIMLEADSLSASLLDRGLPEVARLIVGGALDPEAFREFGPYRSKKMLGEGGMGVVWLAERQDTRHQVAIKFLPHAALSPARRESFAREIRTLARLKHPFIARLYDAGAIESTPWFAMEYVEGGPLSAYLKEHPLSVNEKLKLFRSICSAVQYAHGQEIIHRDLKPSNVLVESDGTPRLLDFGIAKQLQKLDQPADRTQAGLRFGSPDYSAPEWLNDGAVGFYTDVYSLGVILYEMLTGRLPGSGDPEKPSAAAARSAPFNKAAWNDLDVLCLKAMHKDPAQRYSSVEALSRDIDHYLKSEPLEARPDTIRYRAAKFVARNRHAVFAASLALALVAGLIVFFTLRLARERNRADHETAIETAMNRFLSEDLMGRTDPFRSGNAQELFVDVVKQASTRIDLKFRAEPMVAGRLHHTLAGAFDRRSDFPLARKEYDRADQLFRQAEGALSPDAMVARLQLASMEARSFEAGSLDRAKALLAGVDSALSKVAAPRNDVAVWLYMARGSIAVVGTDARSGEENFSAAVRGAESNPAFDESSRNKIKQMVAFSLIHRGDGAKAELLLREIVSALSRTEPDSPDVLRARIYLTQSLMTQGKYTEAVAEADVVYPALLKKVGEDNETVLTVLSTRAASEGYLGRYDDAIRDDLTAHRIALRTRGPATFSSIAPLSDAALTQCTMGRYAEGEPNAREAFEQSRKTFGPRSGLTGGTAYALAYCLIRTNKLDEALNLLRNINVEATAQQAGDPNVGASITLEQAEIAARRGDFVRAKGYLDAVEPIFARPSASASDKADLKRLRILLDAHLQ
jgi:eukaryotic-like serine/threonine-protein kinase